MSLQTLTEVQLRLRWYKYLVRIKQCKPASGKYAIALVCYMCAECHAVKAELARRQNDMASYASETRTASRLNAQAQQALDYTPPPWIVPYSG